MWLFSRHKSELPTSDQALPGRDQPIVSPGRHTVLGAALAPPYPAGAEIADFALGCFWGAERIFWQAPGVISTAVGYEGGFTKNPTYEEVCSGRTGHTETVRVVYDPSKVSFEELLKRFWEGHDPTQGMRQGNDAGTQYRSAIFTTTEAQLKAAEASRDLFQPILEKSGYGPITTTIQAATDFHFAEEYHQQYLDKNPNGYCGHGGTGVSCPIGVARAEGV